MKKVRALTNSATHTPAGTRPEHVRGVAASSFTLNELISHHRIAQLRRVCCAMLLCLLACTDTFAQKVALKHNVVWDALKTPNLSLEVAMGRKWTVDTHVGMNFFLYTTDAASPKYTTRKFSHWTAQPELRWWTCDVFNGWFVGLHAHGGQFNVGQTPVPFILHHSPQEIKQHRYEGYFYGAGISTGYQWVLSPRFNLEASLGVGYAHIVFDKFKCATCGKRVGKGGADYLGPTKAAISIIYMLK